MCQEVRPAYPGLAALNGKLIDKCIAVSHGGIGIQQLRPIAEVGTSRHVSKRRDMLVRWEASRHALPDRKQQEQAPWRSRDSLWFNPGHRAVPFLLR